MKPVKISIKTPWDKQLIAEMKAQKTTKTAIINKILAEKFDPASSAPETLTPGKCCIECVHGSCPLSGECYSGHEAKKEAEQAGACAKCQECLDWTAVKPKKEK